MGTSTSRFLLVAMHLVVGFLATGGPTFAGPAINQFEVKDLEVEQGEVELEVQSDWTPDFPRRKFVDEGGGDLEFDDNEIARQRHAAEIGMGLTNWLKVGVGIEFEQERIDDPDSLDDANDFGSLTLTEAQIEALAVIVPLRGDGIGLGAYAELQLPRSSEEANTIYLGSIIQAVNGPWSATANLALVKFFNGAPKEGEPRDEKLDFAYFTQVKYDFSDRWALALEAYGTIDRLGDTGHASEVAAEIGDQDQHRIGPVAYHSFKRPSGSPTPKATNHNAGEDDDEGTVVTVSTGVLFGLTEDTPDTTIKAGLEVEF